MALRLRCPQKLLLIFNALICEVIAGRNFWSCLTYKAYVQGCLWVHSSSYTVKTGALKIGCAELLNSHSTWCNRTKSRSASLSWDQSGALAQDHWTTELPCTPDRPAAFAAIWAPHKLQACQPSIPSPVVALKNLGPFSCFATFSQVPKDSNSSGFFPIPKRCTSESMAPSLQTS